MYSNIGINKHKYINNLSRRVKRINPNTNAYYSYTYNFDDLDDKYYDMMRKKYQEFYKGFLDDDSMNNYYEKKRNECCEKDNIIGKAKLHNDNGSDECCIMEKMCDCIEEKYENMKDCVSGVCNNMKNTNNDCCSSMMECDDECCSSMIECENECCDSEGNCTDYCCDPEEDCMSDCCDSNYGMHVAKKAIMISLGVMAGVVMVKCLMKRKW